MSMNGSIMDSKLVGSSNSTQAGVSSSTQAGVSSSTQGGVGSCLNSLMADKAASQIKTPDMLGENGDPCHFDLGHYATLQEQLMSDTLGFKQHLVGNDPKLILSVINVNWPKVTAGLQSMSQKDRKTQIVLLFKLAFFARAIRCQGGRSRVQFYLLFQRLRQEFPQETLSVVKLIPFYGCFQDVDHLVNVFRSSGDEEMVLSLLSLYRDSLVADLSRLLSISVATIPVSELHNRIDAFNKRLKVMNPKELSDFLKTLPEGEFSWAGKWVKREGKKNSAHRDDLIRLLFGYSKSSSKKTMDFGRMLLRKCASSLSQCLRIPEQHMTEALPGRGWGDLNLKYIPSKATTNFRLALSNKTKDGLERSSREDRRKCAQNTMKAILDGKLNGAQQDLQKLADLIWDRVGTGSYGYRSKSSGVMTEEEKLILNAQWKKMVEFVNHLIEETLEKDRKLREEAVDAGDTPPEPIRDPRAVMPVVDVSGSMSGAGVMHYAIAMGILCATISSIPGKLITFSESPEVFSFDPSADIFDVFRLLQRCAWGYNTNLDATYKLLLGEMKAARSAGMSISTDFSLLIVTDGQFDSMVCYEDRQERSYSRSRDSLSGFDSFQTRQEKAFTDAGFGVPLVVYWNMALGKPGFPAQSDTTGVKLVAGFSQTIMVEVMTGDYKTVVDPETGAVKVSVTPLESFMKTMSDDSLQPVEDALVGFWSSASQPDGGGSTASGSSSGKISVTFAPPLEGLDKEIADLERQVEEVRKSGKIADFGPGTGTFLALQSKIADLKKLRTSHAPASGRSAEDQDEVIRDLEEKIRLSKEKKIASLKAQLANLEV